MNNTCQDSCTCMDSTECMAIAVSSHLSPLNLIFLMVANPRVRFAPRRGVPLTRGVATSLKRFLNQLEKHGIEHPEEKVIREQLSPCHDATKHSKSFFLRKNVDLRRIDRSVAAIGSTVSLTCVCVSQGCIPQETLFGHTDGRKR